MKKAEVAILISNKTDFKTKTITSDNGHDIINIYESNIKAQNHTKKILVDIKGEIDSNTVIAGDF